ncbi:hypothetical protein AGR5A_Cc90255 [Agrobacterium genomosp. 5 str. CFBP 6626]|nr:hypothetical protein AGR5A_Cc90255 [Agrobacterium genomosp. 5 str. CFBP 6626]
MRLLTFLIGSLFFSLQPALVPEAVAEHRVYDPCTDGSISDGKPRSCSELKRELRRSDRYGRREWEYYRPMRPERIDPCTDGRFSDGQPRSCEELRRWLDVR